MSKKAKAEAAAETVRVRNTREGSIALGNYTGLEIPPGVSRMPVAVLDGLPDGTKLALKDMVAEGWLVFGEEPEPASEPAPLAPAATPEGFQPLPTDYELALKAIEAETSEAVLNAWFESAKDSPAVSEALLKKLTDK
jgi:hypothetical protein